MAKKNAKGAATGVAEVGGKTTNAEGANAGKGPAQTDAAAGGESTEEEDDGKDAYGRMDHPLIGSKDKIKIEVPNAETGKLEEKEVTVYPFRKTPDDFDQRYHRPLGKAHFIDEATYFEHKAFLAEKQMLKYKKKAEQSRALGTGDQRKAKAKITRLAEQMLAQKKLLMEQEGMSEDEVNELLATAGINIHELEAEAAAAEAEAAA